jgi:hypothetical protein
MFVAWGGSLLEDPGADLYLRSRDSFRHLPSIAPIRPTVLFQWDAVGGGDGDGLVFDPRSSKQLVSLLEETAASAGITFESTESIAANDLEREYRFRVATSRISNIYVTHHTPNYSIVDDDISRIQADKLQRAGEALALALTRVMRQTSY